MKKSKFSAKQIDQTHYNYQDFIRKKGLWNLSPFWKLDTKEEKHYCE